MSFEARGSIPGVLVYADSTSTQASSRTNRLCLCAAVGSQLARARGGCFTIHYDTATHFDPVGVWRYHCRAFYQLGASLGAVCHSHRQRQHFVGAVRSEHKMAVASQEVLCCESCSELVFKFLRNRSIRIDFRACLETSVWRQLPGTDIRSENRIWD